MRFLKMSTFLQINFVAETNLADGHLVQLMENGEEILKLRGRSRIPVTHKDVWQYFVPP
jgi:hypothetical protein